LTQRAIHKIEQGDTEPRRTTIRVIEKVWREEGVEFEDPPDGGFRVTIRAAIIERPPATQTRRQRAARTHLGITTSGRRKYRA
jgi:hypothetical protein